MTTNEKIAKLRQLMKQRNISVYIVPTDDFHSSEYVGLHFKERSFITGFTGSAGTAVITEDSAHLWTDGRYFIQAAKQIADSEVILEKMGVAGTPSVEDFIDENLKEGTNLGFDGRCVNFKKALLYEDIAVAHGADIYPDEDLVGMIWEDRPELPKAHLWILEEKYSGESTESKLSRIRKEMELMDADMHLCTCLYDNAWILNLRGDDIANVPVFLSFLLIKKDSCVLFANSENWTDDVKKYLADNKVEIRAYDDVYEYLANDEEVSNAQVLIDEGIVNFNLVNAMPEETLLVTAPNPSEQMRAEKNATEQENIRKAHVKDGVAVTKFIYWLKNNIGKEEITEISAADYIAQRRKEQEHFVDLSFDTIAAYGPNAAMMHYSAKPESFATLKPEGFLLVDSGAHYLEGTTDITRTTVLGPLTDKMKEYYTLVLRCHLRMMSLHFMEGMTGTGLDIIARSPVWEHGLDYRCGTGHGVGYILNVHEGPHNLRFRMREGDRPAAFVPGMIITDEPGLYIENEFGIRIENELLVVFDQTTEYGNFFKFEPVTYAPYDLDAVIVEELDKREKEALNAYNKLVYETISPYLTEDEKLWLAHETREV